MPVRKAFAEWNGDLRAGAGRLALESGAFAGPFSFSARFEDGGGTNPEELLAAAHAACFTMALSARLSRAGFPPQRLRTEAAVRLEREGEGWAVTEIVLDLVAQVPGMDEVRFLREAQAAKENCPISRALAGVPQLELQARLIP